MTTQTETAKINPLHRDITDAEWDAMIGAAPLMLEALKVLAEVDASNNSPKRIREIALAAIHAATVASNTASA